MLLSTYLAYCVLFLMEMLLNRLLRAGSTDQAGADKHSLRLIWLAVTVGIVAASALPAFVRWPLLASGLLAQRVGVGVLYAGVALRLLVVYTLGQFFTVDVTIRQNHQLKTDGFYRYLRHPSYSASLLTFVGLGITFNNWLSLLLLLGIVLAVFLNRIRVEEQALVGHFGAAYEAYRKTTAALLPFVY